MQFKEFLSNEEVIRIHEASIEILEDVGILVHNEKAREIYARHGCLVNSETGIVKFSGDLVEQYRKAFVPTFSFKGRDPQFDRTIPNDKPLIVTGSSAPNIIDPKTGKERRAISSDLANIAFLINELPGFDVFSTSTLAADAPEGQFSLSRSYPALKNCLKPVRTNTPSMKDLLQILELGFIVADSKAAYQERPLITHHCCPVISPLTMDVESTEAVMYLTANRFPAYATIVPSAGSSAPMTLTGTLVLGNAEFLATNLLTQMIRPETPIIYAVLPTVTDMRSGAYAPGGIENGMLHMAFSQMARFYGVPSGGYVGQTNSQLNDSQAGYETGMNTTGALMAGASLFNMGGLLGGLMAFDFAKAVLDNEIALMLKRIEQGMEFSEENLALDLIKEIGPGGTYLDKKHTRDRMRTTGLMPKIANRDLRSTWEKNGALDAHTRALKEAERILSKHNPAVLPADIDAKIQARFEGMVDGKAVYH
jgi:trimethylamine---corrinoid protein Co-methyltransferase